MEWPVQNAFSIWINDLAKVVTEIFGHTKTLNYKTPMCRH